MVPSIFLNRIMKLAAPVLMKMDGLLADIYKRNLRFINEFTS
ncbi:MAG TPA: hypothetical protein VNM69_17430 [Bacillus sp. (in: firmicutes)]|nr:hypothetical protein [Bacillus litorisediminis]HWO77650.1 hypothetical protein [Bacillus sp. (in: firmicutes)]